MTSPRFHRRALLGTSAVAAGIGVAAGAGLVHAGTERPPVGAAVVPFHGARQAGVETPPQAHALFAAFDLARGAGPAGLASLLADWTAVARALSQGEPPPPHPRFADFDPTTDLANGLGAQRLTVTFGLGPSLFDAHPGLADRPRHLRPLPHFSGDRLRAEWTGGDLLVQVCADDRQVVSHAFRALRARAPGLARLRWNDIGFLGTAGGTPRTILGHKDGTANPPAGSPELAAAVWTDATDGEPDWFAGGTYLAYRKIRTRLADWDLTAPAEQDRVIGRRRGDGAPLGAREEFDEPDLEARTRSGALVIPEDAHIRRVGGIPMLRRGYSYDYGLRPSTVGPRTDGGHGPDGHHDHGHGGDHDHGPTVPHHDDNHDGLDAGLLFAAYVRTPEAFIRAQQEMTRGDALQRFLEHTGGGLFAIPPGVAEHTPIAEGVVRG